MIKIKIVFSAQLLKLQEKINYFLEDLQKNKNEVIGIDFYFCDNNNEADCIAIIQYEDN